MKIFNLQCLALILSFTLLSACNSGNSSSAPDLSAVPHADALPSTELSAADKKALSNANGLSIEAINMGDMQNMLSQSTNQLYIYSFWHSACVSCLNNLKNLKEISTKYSPDKVKIITVNVGDRIGLANLTIRENNVPFESFKLTLEREDWYTLLDENWDGSIPAMFMVNKSEEIFLKYYKSMHTSELDAIIQTLVI